MKAELMQMSTLSCVRSTYGSRRDWVGDSDSLEAVQMAWASSGRINYEEK